VLLSIAILPLSAGTNEKADEIIYDLREIVFQQDLNDEEIKKQYELFKSDLNVLNLDEEEFYYYNSMIEYWMGRAYQSFDVTQTVIDHHLLIRKGKYLKLRSFYTAPEKAISHYETALEYIDEYIKLHPDSTGYHQYSEIQAELILLKPASYVLTHGMAVKRTLKKSLKLDPKNVKAFIADGASDIYTPAKYGGDYEAGIERLKSALKMEGADREDFFNIYTHIAYGLIVNGRHTEAIDWLKKAENIYPGNIYLSGLMEMATKGI
jgi:tetratricopeptide (TPR) repeat protein